MSYAINVSCEKKLSPYDVVRAFTVALAKFVKDVKDKKELEDLLKYIGKLELRIGDGIYHLRVKLKKDEYGNPLLKIQCNEKRPLMKYLLPLIGMISGGILVGAPGLVLGTLAGGITYKLLTKKSRLMLSPVRYEIREEVGPGYSERPVNWEIKDLSEEGLTEIVNEIEKELKKIIKYWKAQSKGKRNYYR